MENATDSGRKTRRWSKNLVHLAHGGLFACSVIILGQYALPGSGALPVAAAAVSFQEGLEQQQGVSVQPAMKMADMVGPFLSISADDDLIELSEEMQRVRDWVASTYKVTGDELEPALVQAEAGARDAGLDPLLIVAMMAIESSFDPTAVSHRGAQGLMQVIPRWHKDKIGAGADEGALFDPVTNVRVGIEVLAEGVRRFGSLQAALQYYGGARNDPKARYSKKVLAMKSRLSLISRSDELVDKPS